MATKLVIGKAAPKSFPMKVEVPTPHGPCEINFEAKYLPSTEWAKLREAHAEAISKATQELFDAAEGLLEAERFPPALALLRGGWAAPGPGRGREPAGLGATKGGGGRVEHGDATKDYSRRGKQRRAACRLMGIKTHSCKSRELG